jgi:flavin reductase (DIM6/NTAB) family NADH-FMN oxidoreductase RutF
MEADVDGTIDMTGIAEAQAIEPAILYFGTPVALIGSTNEDGSFNLAPMSSAWWVGWRCMLGLARNSKTTANMAPERGRTASPRR